MPTKGKKNLPPPIKSVTDYINAVEAFADGWTSIIYRGQSNADYELSSSAYRKINGDKGATKAELYEYHKQILLESRQLADTNNSSEADFCQLAHLQHHGAPTVLLDYSYNPLVALYFACQKSSSGDKDGAVYCFNHSTQYIPYIQKEGTLNNVFYPKRTKIFTEKGEENNSFVFTPPESEGSPRIHDLFLLEPPHINQRILAQQSILLLHTEGKIDKRSHQKIIIDNNSKEKILGQLRLLGISEKTLFPDTPGFARWFTPKTGIERYEQLIKEADNAFTEFTLLEPSQQNDAGECEKIISFFKEPIRYAEENKETIGATKSEYAYAGLAHVYAHTLMNGNIDQLKKLYEEHSNNEWIAENYTWGLIKLIGKQELQESTKNVAVLQQLHERFPNNEWIAGNYSLGLASLAEKRELQESTKNVALLKQLHERFPNNERIAGIYSLGLVKLIGKQELQESTKNVVILQQLHERFPNNEWIAENYSLGLASLAQKRELQESTKTVALLKQLHERFPNNEGIALSFSLGLSSLIEKQNLPESTKNVALLKQLHECFPNNEDIALSYSLGLSSLTEKQNLPESTITVETLKQLLRKYPNNEGITKIYSLGLVELAVKQKLLESTTTIETLK